MKVLLLAAGRGERMRPLTDTIPKPLLRAGGRSLIEWQIKRLAQAGFREFVINVSHLGEQIESRLGDGKRFEVRIQYSREPEALETAGGIAQALPLLGPGPFLVVNTDIYCEYEFKRLHRALQELSDARSPWTGHLVLVDNPAHHPQGDFYLSADAHLRPHDGTRLTFSGIGAYRPQLFAGIVGGERRALGPLLQQAVARGELRGEHFTGLWMDIGTPDRLERLRTRLRVGPGR